MLWKIIMTIMTSQRFLSIQCLAFLALNVLDGLSTWLVMRPDHFDRERNPIARTVFRALKPPASIIFFKATLLSALGVFFAYWWREALTLNIALLIGNLLYIFVVRHNIKVHKKYEENDRFFEKLKNYKVITE